MNCNKFMHSFLIMVIVVLLHSSALALVTSRSDTNIDFQFNNPGARANAMGGAFIGVADDATAAYTNPAGLTILTQPEASVEFKATEQTTPIYFTDGDIIEEENNVSGVSFMSFVKPSKKISFALFRHELLNLDQEFNNLPQFDMGGGAFLDLYSELDIKAATYGAGIGLKLSDSLSLGLSVGFTELDYRYRVDFLYDGEDYIVPDNQFSKVDGEDSETCYTLSFLYNPFENFNVGMVYRSGPEFDTTFDYTGSFSATIKNRLKIPDIYGLGISYRFFNCITVAIDATRIEYSDLLDNYIFLDDSIGGFAHEWKKNRSEFEIEDTTEIHAGIEYVFSYKDTPLAIRCGYASRPEHNIYYTDTDSETEIEFYKETRKRGEDDDIFSFGFGAVVNNQIQIDVSASTGDYVKDMIISFVYRFE